MFYLSEIEQQSQRDIMTSYQRFLSKFSSITLSLSRKLGLLNAFLFSCVTGLVLLILLLSSQKAQITTRSTVKSDLPSSLPKNLFSLPSECYEKIGEGALALKWTPPHPTVPDLRKELFFLGPNLRPDVLTSKSLFHVGLKSSSEVKSLTLRDRHYLTFQSKTSSMHEASNSISRGAYTFSPDNKTTPLWIELSCADDHSVRIIVGMTDEAGRLVNCPEEIRCFNLQKGEGQRNALSQSWEIGGNRVDATLLVRQKARWIGPDKFLEKHGGSDFAYTVGRERIDFIDPAHPYACFVKEGDFLIWKENQWKFPAEDENTSSFPLLVVKKVDEKLMAFELWDREGRGKIPINLIRARGYEPLPDLKQEFKFVGAKTWAQFIVEARSERLILRPHDWLLLTAEGWEKIDTAEKVDLYVSQKLVGPLFILEKMSKLAGKQVLIGHIFNATRTEVFDVELPAVQSSLMRTYPSSLSLPPPLKTDVRPEFDEEGS